MSDAAAKETVRLPLAVRRQCTVARPVTFRGLSLFHGADATVRLLPAAAGSGRVFRRIDLPDQPEIPARCEFLTPAPRRTVLANGSAVVETVEHLMSALAGLHVDNCVIEINAREIPAYDGSCRAFCDGILEAGLDHQDQTVTPLAVSTIWTAQSSDGKQSLVLRPYLRPCPAITYQLDYGARALIPPQQLSCELTPEYFYEQISAARTFVLESEVSALKKMGFGQHLTTKELVVIGRNGPIDNQMRWPDECVRHKILDCIGDLALSARDFCGHLFACRSGHQLNHEMARVLTKITQSDSGCLLEAV